MKFGMHYIYWQKDLTCKSYVPYVKRAKDIGFDVLELGDYLIVDMPESEVDALAAETKKYDIELMLGMDPKADASLTSDDLSIRNIGIDVYCNLLPRLQKLGIKTLNGNLLNAAPRFPVTQYIPKEWELGVDSIQKIGKRAAEYGISLNVEVTNRYDSHLLNTAEQAVELMKDVGLPNVRILLDTYYMANEEDSFYNAFATAGQQLGHIHLNDNSRRLPGLGNLPWREIRDGIMATGFDGTMTMEPLVQAGAELGDFCRIWRDLTFGTCDDDAKLDAAAAEALQFVKYLFKKRP